MSLEEKARRWEGELMRLLLGEGISPPAFFSGAAPISDADDAEAKLRAVEEEVCRAEMEWKGKLRELGLDPEQLRAEPVVPPEAIPEDPEQAIRALDARVLKLEEEFEAKLRELGPEAEPLRAESPPPMPDDPEESLRKLEGQMARSESAYFAELRKLGIDPQGLKG